MMKRGEPITGRRRFLKISGLLMNGFPVYFLDKLAGEPSEASLTLT
jgi:hypothetical protein